MKATVTSSDGLLCLAENARGRNRSVHEDRLARDIDPNGTHVMGIKILHNNTEWRTQWFCKMRDTSAPATIWLDVSFEALKLLTQEMEVEP